MYKIICIVFTALIISVPIFADSLAKAHSNLQNFDLPDIVEAIRIDNHIYIATQKNGIKIFDILKGKVIKEVKTSKDIRDFTIGNGKIYILLISGKIEIVDQPFAGNVHGKQDLNQHPDRGIILVEKDVVAIIKPASYVEFRQISTMKKIGEARLKAGVLYGQMTGHFKDGKLYIVAGYPGRISIVDVKTRQCHLVSCYDWNHSVKIFGNKAFTAGSLEGINVVDLTTGEEKNLTSDKNASLFTKNGKLFAITAKTILELDPETEKIINKTFVKNSDSRETRAYIIDIENGFALIVRLGKGLALVKFAEKKFSVEAKTKNSK